MTLFTEVCTFRGVPRMGRALASCIRGVGSCTRLAHLSVFLHRRYPASAALFPFRPSPCPSQDLGVGDATLGRDGPHTLPIFLFLHAMPMTQADRCGQMRPFPFPPRTAFPVIVGLEENRAKRNSSFCVPVDRNLQYHVIRMGSRLTRITVTYQILCLGRKADAPRFVLNL